MSLLLLSFALVCDPDPMWEQTRQATLRDCYLLRATEKQKAACDEADHQLQQEGWYCNPLIGQVTEALD